MKNKTSGIILLIIASLCFLASAIATAVEDEILGYRFFLQIVGGVIFFILALKGLAGDKSKRSPGTEDHP